MVTNYNGPDTQYNKTPFGKLGVADSKTLVLKEAIYQGNDEKIQILAWIEEVKDVKNFDDKGFVFKPQACIFEILLKPYTYKEKTVEPTPAMLVLAEQLKAIEPGKPFSASINFAMGEWEQEILTKGTTQGAPVTDELKTMILAANCSVTPLDAIVLLEGKALPEMKKGGSWGGSKGESTSERITARIAYLNKVVADPTQLAELLAIGGLTQEQFVQAALLRLLD